MSEGPHISVNTLIKQRMVMDYDFTEWKKKIHLAELLLNIGGSGLYQVHKQQKFRGLIYKNVLRFILEFKIIINVVLTFDS